MFDDSGPCGSTCVSNAPLHPNGEFAKEWDDDSDESIQEVDESIQEVSDDDKNKSAQDDDPFSQNPKSILTATFVLDDRRANFTRNGVEESSQDENTRQGSIRARARLRCRGAVTLRGCDEKRTTPVLLSFRYRLAKMEGEDIATIEGDFRVSDSDTKVTGSTGRENTDNVSEGSVR